jgi:hypothetical protein
LALLLARLEVEHGDPLAVVDNLTMVIRNYHDSGHTEGLRAALAILAAFFDSLGRYEPAATIAGFAINSFTSAALPESTIAITHLRRVMGEATFESLARMGEVMTTSAMVTYAYDQIDLARAALNAVSE